MTAGTGRLNSVILYALLIIVLIVFTFPWYWTISASFTPESEIASSPPTIIFWPTIDNYLRAFYIFGFGSYLANSIIVSSGTTLVALILGILAGYSFSRFRFRGNRNLALWILSIRMLPPVATAIPLFLIFNTLHLFDTNYGTIVADLSFSLPLSVWLMRAFIEEIPRPLEEAALVDGCSRLRALWEIIIPVARPGIAVTAIFVFLFSWNDFQMASILTAHSAETLTVRILAFSTLTTTEWGPLYAGITLSMVPIFIVFYFMQKHIVKGLTMGVVKG